MSFIFCERNYLLCLLKLTCHRFHQIKLEYFLQQQLNIYIYIKNWSTTQTMKIDNIYKKYRETCRYTQWSHFKFTTFSFKSFIAAITGSCLLVACQIETVNWTVKMAKFSIVRLLALDTHPSDRITRPTLLWTFCTAWSEVIWRTYCNQIDFI